VDAEGGEGAEHEGGDKEQQSGGRRIDWKEERNMISIDQPYKNDNTYF